MSQKYRHLSGLSEAGNDQPTYLAIGVFDGVHRGHQQLLDRMISAARRAGARSAVLSFFPHPSQVIAGRQGRLYLCTLEERISLLGEQGLDLVITHPFNEEVRQTRAADFIDNLDRSLNLQGLWGAVFGLGYNREGDLPFLRRLGRSRGFEVFPLQAIVEWDGAPVSSSRVRRALQAGNIAEATGCLGRRYRITGQVIQGDGRGKKLGTPTANMAVWDELVLPANGVYAAYAWLGDERYLAATNIGYRPTFDGHLLNVEAHLLDFDGDLYGQTLSLDLVERVRDEQKFTSLEALVAQVSQDIAHVRRLL
jgi:riboflavin kinase / FMN adenylyltransferase